MKEVEWVEYPTNRPCESGKYLVNIDHQSSITNEICFYSFDNKLWYKSEEMTERVIGVNLYSPFKIIPHIIISR